MRLRLTTLPAACAGCGADAEERFPALQPITHRISPCSALLCSSSTVVIPMPERMSRMPRLWMKPFYHGADHLLFAALTLAIVHWCGGGLLRLRVHRLLHPVRQLADDLAETEGA